MDDKELIARLRNNPTDEEAALAATRIYNLGLLNDLAEANLEAEELTNWLKLKEAEARVEAAEAKVEKLRGKIRDWEARIDACEWSANSSLTEDIRAEMRAALTTEEPK